MRSHIVRIGAFALIASSLAACSDERRSLLAPPAPNDMTLGSPIGTVPPRLTLPSPEDFVEITAGNYHTCARKYNGDVYCWGTDVGTVPVPAVAFRAAVQVDAGGSHTCARTSAGAAYCWGNNAWGQVGTQLGAWTGGYPSSDAGYVLGPKAPGGFATLAPLTFTSISAGGSSTCGTTATGTYCWGQQGNPAAPGVSASVPTLITRWSADPTQQTSSGDYVGLTVGNLHSCALESVGHLSVCWSARDGNKLGQTGIDPAVVTSVDFNWANALQTSARRLSTQQDFTCADMLDGSVQCFGSNLFGQLAKGNFGVGTETWVPQTISYLGQTLQLHGVSAGANHACAIDANYEAWCWGAGFYGQLGNGASANAIPSAQKVRSLEGDPNAPALKFRAIAAGAEHTCGIGFDNHIYCWGHNTSRQLGISIYNFTTGKLATFAWFPVLTI